jgi:hypothetical protein
MFSNLTHEQKIKTLEEALVMWSRRWAFAMTEHSMNQAASQIRIFEFQLAELKAKK